MTYFQLLPIDLLQYISAEWIDFGGYYNNLLSQHLERKFSREDTLFLAARASYTKIIDRIIDTNNALDVDAVLRGALMGDQPEPLRYLLQCSQMERIIGMTYLYDCFEVFKWLVQRRYYYGIWEVINRTMIHRPSWFHYLMATLPDVKPVDVVNHCDHGQLYVVFVRGYVSILRWFGTAYNWNKINIDLAGYYSIREIPANIAEIIDFVLSEKITLDVRTILFIYEQKLQPVEVIVELLQNHPLEDLQHLPVELRNKLRR